MPALIVLALIVVPLAELYVLIQVGQQLGVLPTLALLLAMSLLGGYLLRREGARTWQALREALQAGRLPAREVTDGALVVLGGALLLTPGFLTDVIGLLCILPVTRAVLRRLLTGLVARQFGVAGLVAGFTANRMGQRRPPTAPGAPNRPGNRLNGDIVEGEVVEDGPP